MHHFFEAITNTAGDSLIGYFARVINRTTQNTVTLSSDENGTPIVVVSGVENMAKSDDYGNLSLYVDPGTYHLDIYAPNTTTFLYRVSDVAMNSTKGDPGDKGDAGDVGPSDATFSTLAALKAIDPVTYPSPRLVTPLGAFVYAFVAGNFTGLANDKTVVQLTGTPINQGALVARETSQTASDVVALVTPPAGYVLSDNITRGIQAGLGGRGRNNHFDGYQSGKNVSGVVYSNIGIGTGTLKSLTGGTTGAAAYGTPFPTASGNLAIGDLAGTALTSGYENLLLGVLAGQNLVAGRWNTVVGPHSLLSNQNGECNTVGGSYSLVTFGGNNCTSWGWANMENHATGTNVAVGYNALGGSVTVDRSTAVGTLAMRAQVSGSNNTALGDAALRNGVSGSNNTALGADALGILGTDKTNNTAVGNGAGVGLSNGDGNTFLGSGAGNATNNVSQSMALGLSAQATKSNQAVIGGDNITETLLRGTVRNSTVFTVAGLPSASASGVGARTFVSDATVATFATVVAGGSTNKVPVYSDGTDWRIG